MNILEAINPDTRKVLLKYDFVKKYLQGGMSAGDFGKNLKANWRAMVDEGLDKIYLQKLRSSDDGIILHRKAANSRFVRFARRLGLDIATKEDKVLFIKSTTPEKFLDILSVSSGLLRGIFKFRRWKNHKPGRYAPKSGVYGIDFIPPNNPQVEFKKFFALMQENITVKNIEVWAVKLFYAIIYAHMFRDGNGRLARNAYFIMVSDGLLDEKKSSERHDGILNVHTELNRATTYYLLNKEGIKFENLGDVAADENEETGTEIIMGIGNIQQAKYIAARRVLKELGEWKETQLIGLKDWTGDKKRLFKSEFQKVKIEFFWQVFGVIDDHYDTFSAPLKVLIVK